MWLDTVDFPWRDHFSSPKTAGLIGEMEVTNLDYQSRNYVGSDLPTCQGLSGKRSLNVLPNFLDNPLIMHHGLVH